MTFQEFLDSDIRNAWCEENKVHFYLRKAIKSIDGKTIFFIDIANVEVDDSFKNKGLFQKLLSELLESTDFNFYIENCHNPAMRHIALKFNFTLDTRQNLSNSYYLIRNPSSCIPQFKPYLT